MSTRQPITINILAAVDTSPSTLCGLYDVPGSITLALIDLTRHLNYPHW
jgi:hypothetical protein